MERLKHAVSGRIYTGDKLSLEYDEEFDETYLYLDNTCLEIRAGKQNKDDMLLYWIKL